MHAYYWSQESWSHAWIGGWDAPTYANISGQIAVGENSEVIYRGNDGRMHIYYWSVEHSKWMHDWLENSWQAPSLNNVQGSVAIEANNHIFTEVVPVVSVEFIIGRMDFSGHLQADIQCPR